MCIERLFSFNSLSICRGTSVDIALYNYINMCINKYIYIYIITQMILYCVWAWICSFVHAYFFSPALYTYFHMNLELPGA